MKTMSELDDMIKRLCPDGVEFVKLGEVMDKIFGHFICRSTDSKDDASKRLAYASWFTEAVPSSEFVSDELLFWHYLRYSANLNACVKSKYFDVWLSTELREVLRTTNARVPGCEALNFEEPVAFETAVRVTKEVLTDDAAERQHKRLHDIRRAGAELTGLYQPGCGVD